MKLCRKKEEACLLRAYSLHNTDFHFFPSKSVSYFTTYLSALLKQLYLPSTVWVKFTNNICTAIFNYCTNRNNHSLNCLFLSICTVHSLFLKEVMTMKAQQSENLHLLLLIMWRFLLALICLAVKNTKLLSCFIIKNVYPYLQKWWYYLPLTGVT